MYLPSSRSASLWLTVSSRGPPPPPLAEPQSSDVRAGESVTNECEEECANVGTEEENVDLAMPAAEPAAADAPVMCLESAPAISNMPRRSQSKRRRMSSSQRISRPSCRPCARAWAQSPFTASPSVSRSSNRWPPERRRASAGAHTRGTCTRGAAVRRRFFFFLRPGIVALTCEDRNNLCE